jgi:hypothetical protein
MLLATTWVDDRCTESGRYWAVTQYKTSVINIPACSTYNYYLFQETLRPVAAPRVKSILA